MGAFITRLFNLERFELHLKSPPTLDDITQYQTEIKDYELSIALRERQLKHIMERYNEAKLQLALLEMFYEEDENGR